MSLIIILCKIDTMLINLLIVNTKFYGENERLLTNYFINEHRKHLVKHAFCTRFEQGTDEDTEFWNTYQQAENAYRTKLYNNKIIISNANDEQPIVLDQSVVPDWGFTIATTDLLEQARAEVAIPADLSIEGISCLSPNGQLLATIFHHPTQPLRFLFIVDIEKKANVLSLVVAHEISIDSVILLKRLAINEQTKKIMIQNIEDETYYIQLPYVIFDYNDFTLEMAAIQMGGILANYSPGFVPFDQVKEAIQISYHADSANGDVDVIIAQLSIFLGLSNDNLSKLHIVKLMYQRICKNKNIIIEGISTIAPELKKYFEIIIENLLLFADLTEVQKQGLESNQKMFELFLSTPIY